MWCFSSVRGALMVIVAAATFGSTATAQSTHTVLASSDVRVSITEGMQSLGFELQDAHDFAVLATDGVDLQYEEDVCLTYLVTLWWCDQDGGTETMKSTKVRLSDSCFGGFFPAGNDCQDALCPPGTRRYYALETGDGFCFGTPAGSCVHMEVSGPVESSCDGLLSCSCLALEQNTCEQAIKCVPVVGDPANATPESCPACD